MTGWQTIESGGSASHRGSVSSTPGGLVLTEGDSFVLGIEKTFTIPANTSTVNFTYDNLSFDPAHASTAINDAFESTLVNPSTGQPIVDVYKAHRDAYFNITEGQAGVVGNGTTQATLNGETTVVADVSALPAGTQVEAILRLVDDSADTRTTVRLPGIAASNPPPVLGPIPNQQVVEGSALAIVDTVTDANTSDTYTGTVAWGDGGSSPATIQTTSGVGSIQASHTYAKQGVYSAILSVTDVFGNPSQAPFQVTVTGVSPVPTIAGPPTVVEGATYSLTLTPGAAVTAPITWTVTWGDGTTSTVAGGTAVATATHAYAEAGSDTITAVAATVDGSYPATPSVPVAVTDAPLVATAAAFSPVEGAAFTGVVATLTDANPLSKAADYAATITWGDGHTSAGAVAYDNTHHWFAISGTNTFATAGTYTTSVAIVDIGGSHASTTASTRVADAALTASASPIAPTEGTAFTGVVATFTDADPGGVVADYTSSIAWGDGATSAGTVTYDSVHRVFDVSGSHTYAGAGSDTMTATITDFGGSTAAPRETVTVADAPLSGTAATIAAVEGSAFTGVVATFTDADPGAVAANYTATIAWGDGTSTAGTVVYDAVHRVFDVDGARTYGLAGTYSMTVRVSDYGGSGAIIASTAVVADAALTASGAPGSVVEGSTFTGVVATFTDADPGGLVGDYSATIHWGDGDWSLGTVAYNATNHNFTVSGSETYITAGPYSAVTAITDLGGGTISTSAAMTVTDAPLTAAAVAVSATAAVSFSGPVATFTDPDPNAVASDYSATITWGDGHSSAGTIKPGGSAGSFTVVGSNTFAAEGTYTTSVAIADYGGSRASTTATTHVADAPLSLALSPVVLTEGGTFSGVVATLADVDPNGAVGQYTATITWGDGHTSAGAIAYNATNHNFTISGSDTYARAGGYTLGVSVVDVGGATTSASETFSVADAPLASTAAPISAVEGATFTGVVATFTDPDPGAVAADYTAAIVWGDGHSSAGTVAYNATNHNFTVTGTNTYAVVGIYGATVTIVDYGGSSAWVTESATVADAPLTVTASPVVATRLTPFTGVVATFADANPGGAVADYAATIAWGDGHTTEGQVAYNAALAAFTVTGTEVYTEGGTYATTVTVTDGGGSTGSKGGTATVSDPNFVAAGATISAVQAVPFSGVVATFNDLYVNPASPSVTASIAWGDGHTSAGTVAYSYPLGAFTVTGTNTYAIQGTDAVVVTLTDAGGYSIRANSTANVVDAPLTAAGATFSGTRGVAYTGVVATFTDADPAGLASQFTATIAWGDGDSSAGTVAYNATNHNFTVTGTETFPVDGTLAVTVTIQDVGGASAVAHSTANVPDFALTPTGQAVAATEGAAFTGVVATFTDADPHGAATDFTASIAWGDGHASAGTVAYNAVGHNFTVTGTNTYAAAGSYPTSVTIVDVGGSSTTATARATVADAPLTATGLSFGAIAGLGFSTPVATFTDADPGGVVADYSATIHWGDGATSAGTVAYNATNHNFTVTGSHAYAAVGTDATSITIVDVGGASATIGGTATVTIAPAGNTGVSFTATEGSPFSAVVAVFPAPNGSNAGQYTATITWGDGHTTTGTVAALAVARAYTVTGGETYARAGTYAVGVSITTAGVTTTASATGTVLDAALAASGASLTTTEGSTLTGVVATFTDADPGAVAANYTATIGWGDGNSSAGTVAYNATNHNFTVTGTHAYAEAGTRPTTVTIHDFGGAAATATGSVVVADAALGLTASPFSAALGVASPVLVATFTDADPLSVASDFSATITWGDSGSSAATIAYDSVHAVYDVTAAHAYAATGSFAVGVTVHDVGGTSASKSTTATVADAPINAAGATLWGVEGQAMTGVVATFTDANAAAVAANFTATITWGDGASTAGTVAYNAALAAFTVTGTHTYATAGHDVTSIAIHDVYGSNATAAGAVNVADAPITAVGVTLAVAEGVTFTGVVATFTDADPGGVVADYSAAIQWGDGATSAGTIAYNATNHNFTVTGSHAYAAGAATIAASVVISDVGGFKALAIDPTTVSDSAMTATAGTISATELTQFTGQVATFTDANPGAVAADHWATITWGDGHVTQGTVGYDSVHAVFTVAGSNLYLIQGSIPVSVAIRDKGGASTTLNETARVADVPPVVTASAISAVEGASFNMVVATFTDPLPVAADYTVTIAWGDGTSSTGGILYNGVTRKFLVSAAHTYKAVGSDTVTVSILDIAGTTVAATATATVVDAPLFAAPSPVNLVLGSTFSGVVATFTDADPNGVLADYSATITWGNGASGAGTIVYDGVNKVYDVSGSNTYATAGTFPIAVTIRDVGGSSITTAGSANVADAALAASAGAIAAVEGVSFAGTIATFTDANAAAVAANFTATVNWGDGTSSSGAIAYNAAGHNFTVAGPHTYALQGAYRVTIVVADAAGTTSSVVETASVAGTTIVGTTVLPFAAVEGASFAGTIATFASTAATGSGDGLSATITWGNGNTTPGTITYDSIHRLFDVGGSNLYVSAGTYPVGVTIRDVGGASATASASVSVADAALTTTAKTIAIAAGSTFNGLVATFTDADPNAAASFYSATIAWGDGATTAGAISFDGVNRVFDVVASHAYAAAGTFGAVVTIRDSGGATSAVTDAATVADAPIVATGLNQGPTEGSTFTAAVATFTDANTLAPASYFSATITWGDGHVTAGTVAYNAAGRNFTVTGTDTFGASGSTYHGTAAISDLGGATASPAFTTTVVNAVPVITAAGNLSGNEGQSLGFSGSFTDSWAADTHTATINWGDGTSGAGVVTESNGSGTVAGSHTYAYGGSDPITLQVFANSGTNASRGATASIGFVAPTVTPTAFSAVAGVAASNIQVATFSSPAYSFAPSGTVESFTATINWGDGTSTPGTVAVIQGSAGVATTGTVTGSHTYAAAGTETVSITVADAARFATATESATVTAGATVKFYAVDGATDTFFNYDASGHLLSSPALVAADTQPLGSASDAARDTVWVVDGSGTVYVYNPNGTLRGSWTAGGVSLPQDITTNGTDVWIVDKASGVVDDYAGAASRTSGSQSPSSSFSLASANYSPTGLVVYGTTIWVSDDSATGKGVYVYGTSGTPMGSWTLDSGESDPSAITLNPSGGTDLWVVDRGTDRVYHYAASTGWTSGAHPATDTFALAANDTDPTGIADPTTLTIASPANNASFPAGSSALISGQVTPAAPGTPLVTVNGTPADAVDASGDFFARINVPAGQDTFQVNATAAGQSASQTLKLTGTAPTTGKVDFSALADVTPSFRAVYGVTSLDLETNDLYADMAARDVGTYSVNTPLVVEVRDISNPTVLPVGYDGLAPDGTPYYDYTKLAASNPTEPGSITATGTLAFSDPNRARFTYSLVFLAALNRAPAFTTAPIVQTPVNQPYSYAAQAVDPDGDPVSYSLLSGPSGLGLSPSGVLSWTPSGATTPSAVGTTPIRIQASDGRGGIAEQDYTLTVVAAQADRPPHYTTSPVVDAFVGTAYSYPSAAVDPDNDPLTFSPVNGPAGLTYGATGLASWTPTTAQLGLNPVSLEVSDGRGGYDIQSYKIMVHPSPGELPPYIVSTPPTTYRFSQWAGGSSIVVPVTIRDLRSSFPDVQQGVDTGTFPGLVNTQLGLLQVDTGPAALATPAALDNGSNEIIDPTGNSNPDLTFTQAGTGWNYASGGYDYGQITSSGAGTGPGNGSNVATWSFSGVAAGSYVVQGTWSPSASLATNATYQIKDGTTPIQSAVVNQATAPVGASYTDDDSNSIPFQNLATVTIASGTLNVVLADNANAPVAADAIRLVPATDLGWAGLTGPATGATGSSFTLQRSYTVGGLAPTSPFSIAYYASPSPTLGQGGDLYLGSETISAAAGEAVGTHAGTSPTLSMPGNAGAYYLFAVINSTGSILESVATNDAVAAPQVVTVTGPSGLPPTFVDDASPTNFAVTGPDWTTMGSGFASQAHVTYTPVQHGPGNPQIVGKGGGPISPLSSTPDVATWQLTGLSPGTYAVQASWSPETTLATNATYQVRDGNTVEQSTVVDQTKTPPGAAYPDQNGNYTWFQSLGTVQIASGTLDVVLSDATANGLIEADAIRVTQIQPVDLSWSGGGVSGPAQAKPGASFTIERDYNISGEAAPANFTIAYYASTQPTWGGGTDNLLASETITATSDKTVGNHDGPSPTLTMPDIGGIEYIYAVINAGGGIIEDPSDNIALERGRTPTYTGELWGNYPIIHGTQSFNDWYHDTPGTNLAEEFPIVLSQSPTDPNTYLFGNGNGFFPIDGRLFGNDVPGDPEHNFNFTTEFHGSFTYHGGETISVSSDDDSWVFINNHLVVDNGGVHPPGFVTANIDALNAPPNYGERMGPGGPSTTGLGLVIGQTYPIDIFYAERQTNYADFEVQTNLKLQPDQPYTYQVRAISPEDYPLTYALLKGPLGMSINQANGLVFWEPGRDQVGSYTVTVEALDDHGGTATQTYTLVVTVASSTSTPKFVQKAPTTALSGVPYVFQPQVNNPDGDALYYTLVSGPNVNLSDQMTIDPFSGAVSWTPQPNDIGQPFTVTIELADEQGDTDVLQYTLRVAVPADIPPKFTSQAITTAAIGQLYAYQPVTSDPQDNPLTYDLPVHPAGMVVDPSTGLVEWVPTIGEAGAQQVLLRVRDNLGGFDLQPYTINVPAFDWPPVITSTPGGQPEVGYEWEYHVTAQDADGKPVTISLGSTTLTGLAFDPLRPGVLTWTPTQVTPATSVTIIATDAQGGTSTQTFSLTAVAPLADRPPTINSTPRTSIQLGLTYVYQVFATDPDGDHLTYSLDAPLQGVAINPLTGLLTWTPSPSQVGSHPLQVDVTDGRSPAVTQPFTVNVTTASSNGPPSIVSSPVTAAVSGYLYAYNPAATDPDKDDALTWSLVTTVPGMSIDPRLGTVRWIPGPNDVGPFPVTVRVADPYGASATQSYIINARGTDSPPRITSSPPVTGAQGVPYNDPVQATDPDGDPLTYTIVGTYPLGLAFSTTVPGLLQWNSPVQGTFNLQVVVSDPYGLSDSQSWTLTVSAAPPVLPPTFTSTAPSGGFTGSAYLYNVTAQDPQSDPVTFSLIAGSPTWLSFTSPGVLAGTTPATPGGYAVAILADDGHGGQATQWFTLTTVVRQNPTIQPNPVTSVLAGLLYQYDVYAADPYGAALTYSFAVTNGSNDGSLAAPPLTMDAQGRLTWATTPAYAGSSWNVTVSVRDIYGGTASLPYLLTVVADTTPPVVSVQVGAPQVNVGQVETFQVLASDNVAVRSISVTVNGTPVTIDAHGNGRVVESTVGTYTVTAIATDTSNNAGAPTSASFAVVNPNVTGYPTAAILAQTSTVAATTSDDPTTHLPTFAPVAIPPNQAYSSTITVNDAATLTALTVALGITDADDSTLTATLTSPSGTTITLFGGLAGANLGGTTFDDTASTPIASGSAPYTGRFKPTQALAGLAGMVAAGNYVLKITNASSTNIATLTGWSITYTKAAGADVSAPVNIIGTAADSQAFQSYTLAVFAPGNPNPVQSVTGYTAVSNGVLGQVDPTMLQDGPYTVQLTVTNAGNHTTTAYQDINVSGHLKLGSLHLSYADLTVPVSGIPITITRTYDTLDANTKGDFGYGWTLNEGDFQIEVAQPNGPSGPTAPLQKGARVTFTRPGEDPESFTFLPQPEVTGYFQTGYYDPFFVPDPGTTDTLSVEDDPLIDNGDGTYSGLDADLTLYNPADSLFGGSYTLTTYQKTSYVLDATNGQIDAESDRNDNTLTFGGMSIASDTGRQVAFTRDTSTGDITAITDPNGNSILYGYNSLGDLTSVTDRDGNRTQFFYDAAPAHYLDHVVDAANHLAAQVTYRPDGRVGTVTDATNDVTTLNYATATLSETATAPGASPSALTFDAKGNPTNTVDPAGNATTATYSGNNPTSETQTVGGQAETTRYTYDAYGDILTATDPLNHVTRFTYNSQGEPVTSSDPVGDTTSYQYDDKGNPTATTTPDGVTTSIGYDSHGNVLATTTPDGTTGQTYDPFGDVKTSTDAKGIVTTDTFDNNGNLKTSQWTWVDPAGALPNQTLTTTSTYDNNDQITQVAGPDGTTTDHHNALGQVYQSFDKLGGETDTLYDPEGRVVQVKTPDGRIADTAYDSQGRVQWADDPHFAGQAVDGTNTLYDPDGRVQQTIRYANVVILVTPGTPASSVFKTNGTLLSSSSSTYDAAGRLASSTNAANHATTYQYDTAGNQIEVDDTVNGVPRAFKTSHDASGRVISTTDALNNTTQLLYNGGNLVTTIFPDGSTTSARYDTAGHRIASVDQDGNETDDHYDAYGELSEVDLPAVPDPNNSSNPPTQPVYKYTYDTYGNLATETNPYNNVTSYTYNAFGDKTSETLPMGQGLSAPTGQIEKWTYNALEQLATATDFNGNTIRYTYDTEGRVKEEDAYLPNANTASITSTFTYDNPDSNLDGGFTDTATTTGDGTTTTSFDVNGRLVGITSPQGTVTYGYDPATGARTEITATHAGGSGTDTDIKYTYDPEGRLATVSAVKLDGLATSLTTTYGYDLDNNLLTTSFPNGTVETRGYDALNRLKTISTATSGGATIFSASYTRDHDGNVLTASENSNGATRSVAYTYDADNRLLGETDNGPGSTTRTFTYTYDLAGNRTASTDSGGVPGQQSITYSYDQDDRLYNVYGSGGNGYFSAYYSYNGNTTTVSGTNSASYTYDAEGRMVGATANGQTITDQYDAADDRVSETVNGQTTNFLNDPNQSFDQVLEEYSSGGVLAATYVRGLDLLFQDRSGVRSYYAVDQLGGTRALTDLNGRVTDTYTYDAYGNLINQGWTGSSATTNEFLYAGYQFDAALGQDDLRARNYDPSLGRFIARDTFDGTPSDPISLNHYLYTDANPLDLVDPTGHEGEAVETLEVVAFEANEFGAGVQASVGAARANGVIGTFWNQFGATVEMFAQRVINLIPRINVVGRNQQVGKNLIDFVLRTGDKIAQLEVKYSVPAKAGSSLTRLANQMRSMVANGPKIAQQFNAAGGARSIVWSFKQPTVQALTRLQAEVGPAVFNQVQFVDGVTGLFQYLMYFFV